MELHEGLHHLGPLLEGYARTPTSDLQIKRRPPSTRASSTSPPCGEKPTPLRVSSRCARAT